MNRKNKIIVSVVGITIVLLALLGLTYAYYLTRIQGNTNTNSISVTTADLRLVYRDGSANVVETEIEPSDEVYTKEFTVTNEGNVNIDYGVYLIDVINTFVRKDDIKYKMTCTTDGTLACGQVTSDTTFPSGISEIVTGTIEPTKTHTYTFSFTYKDTGTDQSVDMGKELQAKIQIFGENNNGIIVPFENETLAYNIVNNASNSLNGTTLDLTDATEAKVANQVSASTYGKTNPTVYPTETYNITNYYIAYACDYTINENGQFTLGTEDCPVTTTTTKYTNSAEMISALKGKYAVWKTSTPITTTNQSSLYKISDNEADFKAAKFKYISVNKYVSTEKVLATTEDEYATSYYFRGGVENNYVNFAGMCWRIVRIQGDGSTKIILEDQYAECDDQETTKTAAKYTGAWDIPTITGGTQLTGSFGYTQYSSGGLTDSAGNPSTSKLYIMDYLGGTTSSSSSLATALKNFQTGKLSNYLTKLKSGNWCYNDTAYANSSYTDMSTAVPLTSDEKLTKYVARTPFYYDSYVRLYGNTTKSPTLKCPTDVEGESNILTKFKDGTDMYVGALTADEIAFSGGKSGSSNYAYYLLNDYQRGKSLQWWVLSPSGFDGTLDYAFSVAYDGSLNRINVTAYDSFRPAVTLTSSVSITDGVGTIDDPYIVG